MLLSLNLHEWSDLAQLVIAVFTVAGVIGTAYLSVRALREVQRDRAMRQAPYLAFESGGRQLAVEFRKAGAAIPGMNPNYVAAVLPNLPPDAESVRLRMPAQGTPFYGRLHNLGAGAATDTRVTWEPSAVLIGHERFEIDDAKRSEPVYSAALNTMPALPRLLKPGDTAQLSRLPTFVEKDWEKKVARVEGVLRITCRDVARVEYRFLQEFHLFTEYAGDQPCVHVTFGDLVDQTPLSEAEQGALPTGR